jgi:hypothetical protein
METRGAKLRRDTAVALAVPAVIDVVNARLTELRLRHRLLGIMSAIAYLNDVITMRARRLVMGDDLAKKVLAGWTFAREFPQWRWRALLVKVYRERQGQHMGVEAVSRLTQGDMKWRGRRLVQLRQALGRR